MGLIIRSSSIHAAGCYTTSPIPKGTRVVEYTGPLIDKEEGDRRYENKPITYLFAVGEGTQVIDGHGMAMFINHSCDANCETEEFDGHVWISSVRDIAAGEEICYDYCLFDGDEQDAPCNCGAGSCRGSMFSPEELKRRRSSRTAPGRTVSESRKNGRSAGGKILNRTKGKWPSAVGRGKAGGKKNTARTSTRRTAIEVQQAEGRRSA